MAPSSRSVSPFSTPVGASPDVPGGWANRARAPTGGQRHQTRSQNVNSASVAGSRLGTHRDPCFASRSDRGLETVMERIPRCFAERLPGLLSDSLTPVTARRSPRAPLEILVDRVGPVVRVRHHRDAVKASAAERPLQVLAFTKPVFGGHSRSRRSDVDAMTRRDFLDDAGRAGKAGNPSRHACNPVMNGSCQHADRRVDAHDQTWRLDRLSEELGDQSGARTDVQHERPSRKRYGRNKVPSEIRELRYRCALVDISHTVVRPPVAQAVIALHSLPTPRRHSTTAPWPRVPTRRA